MIYLDNASTTPVAPAVLERMLPLFTEQYGNPSSLHKLGVDARSVVTEARRVLARVTGSRPEGWIFTGNGTEANALALRGVMSGRRHHLAISEIEHSSVVGNAKAVQERGLKLSILAVDQLGRLDLSSLERLDSAPDLVSVMLANNVSGTIQPIEELVARVRSTWPNALVHVDAIQALRKIPFSIQRLGLDLVSVSAHKIRGPKGIGALYCRKGLRLVGQIQGGGQQNDVRSGTENVPAIAGFSAALELAYDAEQVAKLRDRLWHGLQERLPDVRRVGHTEHVLPGHLLVDFGPLEAQILLHHLEHAEIYASPGSACSSNKKTRDPVLDALRIPQKHAVIRFSVGPQNQPEQIETALERIPEVVLHLRKMFRR